MRNRPANGRVIFGNDAPRTDARSQGRKSPFRAGSAISGNCVDRNADGVCDETWARPTEPLRPLPRTGSGTAANEPPTPRTREPESREKEPKPKEP